MELESKEQNDNVKNVCVFADVYNNRVRPLVIVISQLIPINKLLIEIMYCQHWSCFIMSAIPPSSNGAAMNDSCGTVDVFIDDLLPDVS